MIFDLCGTVAGIVTPKGSMPTQGETLLPHTCNVCGRNLITGLTPRVDISSTCKVGQKLGVSLSLLTCSPSAWPSRVLYRRGQKSRRDFWITLYIESICCLCEDVDIGRHLPFIMRVPPPRLTKVLREVSLSLMLFALLDTSVPL